MEIEYINCFIIRKLINKYNDLSSNIKKYLKNKLDKIHKKI